MLADKFQFTAAVATAAANTEKFVVDYLISNHCQNNKNHLITKMTVSIDNFLQVVAAAATAAAVAAARAEKKYCNLSSHFFITMYYMLLSKK
jgi:hypothetical protein